MALAALLTALGAALSFWSFHQTNEAAQARKRSFEVLIRSNALLSELKDAETSQRGFLLSSNPAFLQTYLSVRDGVNVRLTELRELTLVAGAQRHLDALAPLVDGKMEELAQTIALQRSLDTAAALARVNSGEGQRLMDAIRVEILGLTRMQEEAIAQHDEKLQIYMRLLFNALVGASLVILLCAMALSYFLYRQAQQRVKNLGHLETRHLLEVQEQTNRALHHANVVLLESEEKLSVTLNSIGDGVIATDAQARVTRLNPIAEQLTGWTQAQAAGRPVDEVFHIINQETRELAAIPVLETLAHGTIQGLANHTVLIARDSSECSIADSCAPIRDSSGQVIGAVLVFRNVTEEYAVQQALRDSAALVQTILNTVVDAIITIHARGGIVETVNPAAEQMFGYSAADLVGRGLSVLIPELDRDQRNGSLEYYRASAEARASGLGREVMGQRKDGSSFPLEIAVSEMWLGGQRFFTGILRDVTTRKQVEAERTRLDLVLQDKNSELERARYAAEKANLAKSDFLSSMSHELRTPLGAILGFAQLIESGIPTPTPGQQKCISQILKAGWYLLELINEILDLALIESGKLSLSLETVSLGDVMQECEAMIEPQALKRGIRVNFGRLETPHFVSADRTRVKQVLINLLSNAIKYNRSGGSVSVDCAQVRNDWIRISVRDTGAGLAPEQLAQLFQPFNRLGQKDNLEEGTGIGLVVSKRLVELMHGSIGAQSTVGEGSVFWVELGRAMAPQASAHATEPAPLGLVQTSGGAQLHTLLYVEDNPANLMLVEDLIARRPDIRLLTARDGIRGVEVAHAALPDVILMDINLPGISGLKALEILAQDPATAHIPVIALSANAIPRDIEKGLEAGFFRYLTKPIKVNEFMETVDIALKFAKSQAALAPHKEAS